jgi:hypothetical protein
VLAALLPHRTRSAGYLSLLAILVLPELLAPLTVRVVPRDMSSIPAALSGLSQATLVGQWDARRALGCGTILLAVWLVAAFVARANADAQARWRRNS